MMKIEDIIEKYYEHFYNKIVRHNKVISQGRTPEDLLNDVCLTALRKYKNKEIDENEGYNYLKKTLYMENIFQYKRIKNETVIYTNSLPESGYTPNFEE